MYPNLGTLRVYCNSIAHPQHGRRRNKPRCPQGHSWSMCVRFLWLCVSSVRRRRKHNKAWRHDCTEEVAI